MIGQTLGSYSIQRELGRGGMGAVYVGVHTLLGRTAAVKVLLPAMSQHQDIVQRFFNEARAATAIRHPGIVEVYDFGFAADGSAYIVMEFLDGESLSARLRRLGRLPPALALGIARQTTLALAAAHRAGIIHRDLKPDNVFLVPDIETSIGERVKLLDFGIAKLAGEAGAHAGARTSTGAIMGTPYYMSPEQCKGAGNIDPRSDLYSLGCMLHEMCCGRVPFTGEGAGEIIAAHIHVPVTPLSAIAPDVPAEVEALVLRLMAKRADDRPATADALASEITPIIARLSAAPAPVPTTPPVEPPRAISTTIGQASGETVAPARPRRTGMIVAIVGALIVAAGLAIVIASSGGGASPTAKVAPPDAAPRPAPPVVAVAIDAAAKPSPLATALADAKAAAEDEHWPDVVIAAQQALAIDPGNADANALIERAKLEQVNELAYDDFRQALAKDDLVAVVATYAKIDDASMYKGLAKPDFEKAQNGFVQSTQAKAQELASAGKCTQLTAWIKKAEQEWPGAPLTTPACKKAGSGGGETTTYSAPDAATQQLLDDARAAAKNSQWGKAMRLAEQALTAAPGDPDATMIAALAACNLQDRAKAKHYISKLSSARQGMARQSCLRNNVNPD